MHRAQALESVKAFLTNDKDIEIIIALCHLYPSNNSWRKWTDHLGNYIQIHNTRKVTSVTNSVSNKDDNIITDIYFKSHPKKISSISKWAFISFGRDNDNIFNVCFVWFLGCDDRLRLLSFSKDRWARNQPPLICGVETLKPIIRNIGVESYRQADILRLKGPLAANMTKSWATVWPPSDDLKESIMFFNEDLGAKIINSLL